MRRYVILEDGTRVTRATAMNIYAQSVGAPNDYRLRINRARAAGQINAKPTSGKAGRGMRFGKASAQAAQAGHYTPREFRDITANVIANPGDKAPDGPLAQYLYAIGRRPTFGDYSVGDSPTVRG